MPMSENKNNFIAELRNFEPKSTQRSKYLNSIRIKSSTLIVLVGSLLFGIVGPLPVAHAAARTTPNYVTASTTTSVVLTLPGATPAGPVTEAH